ncbi:hypothetical protein FOZ61_007791 [Perkinsus olseni]|uniref:Uncharacterized protein n=2 Tax=Perkinsus olseni TaxID=32597 RepID=A0A7J6L799_PEROL|nr:hypothetical protein FOZ61_007791 [Perkinsus olseni]KAF4659471.1 hypothetical protein FOL46_006572 [Perkinsus olseni]
MMAAAAARGPEGEVNLLTSSHHELMVNKCGAQMDCISCYNSSYLCHWCADNPEDPPGPDIPGSCHYKGSVYGCKYGAVPISSVIISIVGAALCPVNASLTRSARERSQCKKKRVKPGTAFGLGAFETRKFLNKSLYDFKYIGSVWAPRAVAWSLILIIAIASTCGGMMLFSCRRMKNAVARANQLDRELQRSGRARRRQRSEGADDYLLRGGTASDDEADLDERARGYDYLSLASLLDPCASCLYKTLGCCWAVGMILLLVGSGVVAAVWPHQPVVNYCNIELVWNRTLAMVVESALVKTDIEMESLVSVYNPNRLGVRINHLSGNIYYKGAEIGTMALHNFAAPGGYVSDGLGLITYNALDRAAEMLIDYKWNKDLVLTVTGTISFDILWPNSEVLTSLSASVPPAVINLNKVPDQRYCKCQGNITQGSSSSWFMLVDDE